MAKDVANIEPAPGTTLRIYMLTRWEKCLAFRVAARIRRDSGSEYRTYNIYLATFAYLAGLAGFPDPQTLCPPTPRDRAFPLYLHEDQAELLDLAIREAKAAIEIDDEAAAFVHILREVYQNLAGKKP